MPLFGQAPTFVLSPAGRQEQWFTGASRRVCFGRSLAPSSRIGTDNEAGVWFARSSCKADTDEVAIGLTGSLMDYGIPRADTLPAIDADFSPVPSTTNPLGIRGVGEGGTIAATPTVTNAVLDALAPPGVSDVPMPAARERIWRAIHESARS